MSFITGPEETGNHMVKDANGK